MSNEKPRNNQIPWFNLGGIRTPVLPFNVVLTDRNDGTLWHVSYTTTPPFTDGLGYITITTDIPVHTDKYVYPAVEGPYLGQSNARLMVRGGYLGVEVLTLPEVYRNQGAVYARVQFNPDIREIKASDTPNEYAWRQRIA